MNLKALNKKPTNSIKKIAKLNVRLFSIKPMLFVCYFVMILIWAVSPFITSYIIGNMFDVLEIGNMEKYYCLVAILFGLNMFSIYVMRKAGVVDALIGFFVGKTIKENIVKQLISMKNNVSVGKILDIISYDVEILEYMLLTQLELVSQCLFVVGATIVLMNISFTITMFIIIPLIIISILYWKWCTKYKAKYVRSREENINYSIRLTEFITNREAIQFFASKGIFDEFKRVIENKNKVLLEKVGQNILMDAVTELIKHIGILLILIYYLARHKNTSLTVGNIVLFISYVGYAGAFLQLFNSTASVIKGSENTLERVSEIINGSELRVVDVLVSKARNEIRGEKANFALKLCEYRLSNLDKFHEITINRGEMIGVTGDTGSGKTLFLDSILGYSSYEGKIFFDRDNDYNKIGYVPQDIHLFDASIEENITIFGDVDEEKYEKVCVIANIDSSMIHSSSHIGVNGKELSEGQRQRVAIARALYNNTGIVILDDAFAYLDKDNRNRIVSRLSNSDEFLVVFSTNDSQLLNNAKSVLILKNMIIECT